MEITRTINGQSVVIELTHSEMEAAFLKIQAEHDRLEVCYGLDELKYDSRSQQSFRSRFGLSVNDIASDSDLVDRIAVQKRRLQNGQSFDSLTALSKALEKVLPEYVRERSPEALPAEFLISNDLPDECFSVSDGQLVVIKRGCSGYYPADGGSNDFEENSRIARSRNFADGISDVQVKAMEFGCSFGWDSPGADPANYGPDGKMNMRRAAALEDQISRARALTSPAVYATDERPEPQL